MRRGRRRGDEGFSLLELVVAAAVIVVAVFGVAAAFGSASLEHQQSRSTAIAVAALRDRIAEIQARANTDMSGLYDYCTGAGRDFDVPAIANVHPGLTPPAGFAHVGTVLCWNNETGAASPAGANAGDAARAGLPRDLNMDDDSGDTALVSGDMKAVPMKITLDFVDARGARHMEIFFLAGPQR